MFEGNFTVVDNTVYSSRHEFTKNVCKDCAQEAILFLTVPHLGQFQYCRWNNFVKMFFFVLYFTFKGTGMCRGSADLALCLIHLPSRKKKKKITFHLAS